MKGKFKSWCRLCAKPEGCTKDLLAKDETSQELHLAVERHFLLQIEPGAEAPTTICSDCHDWLIKLIQFEKTVIRSQDVFDCSDEETIDVTPYIEEEEVDVLQQGSYVCSLCTESFHSQSDLDLHEKSHVSGDLSCDICGSHFSKIFCLRNHRKLVHSDIRPFICDECGKGFKRSGDLTRHKEFHSVDKPFACRICGKRFKSKLVVKMHEKNHTEEKHTCTVCGQELKNKHTLRGHMQTHNDDLPYACQFCAQMFRYKKNLNCHLLTHTGVQPYSCAFCSQSFSLRWNCRTHQKKFHAKELEQFELEGKVTIVTNLVKQEFACGQRRPKVPLTQSKVDDTHSKTIN